MKRAGIPVGVGTRFAYDGEIVEIVELHTVDGAPEVLAKDLRSEVVRRFALAELMFSDRARLLSADLSDEVVDARGDTPAVVWSAAPEIARRQARARAAHVREVLTGYRSGSAETALPGEPRTRYRTSVPMGKRIAAKAKEIKADGVFVDEIVPVEQRSRGAVADVFSVDEGVRADSSVEILGTLRALQLNGTVTAGNSAQQNDAAAACLVVSERVLSELALEPIAYFEGWSAVGCEPSMMGIGPVGAIGKLLKRRGLDVDDLDLIEINEAFAVQVLAVLQGLEIALADVDDRLNVNGSAISLGHPIGATGARILTTMLHELRRRDGRYALEAMCVGGGQGLAALFSGA